MTKVTVTVYRNDKVLSVFEAHPSLEKEMKKLLISFMKNELSVRFPSRGRVPLKNLYWYLSRLSGTRIEVTR